MKKNILVLLCLILTNLSFGQNPDDDLKMISSYSSENPEIHDILEFEGIEYLKIQFIGSELKNKSYHLTVKEIWDGKIVSDNTIVNSAISPYEQFQKVNDTVFNIKVISKKTNKNKLKMTFKLPRFMINREFNAIDTDDYSLRNIAEESKMEVCYDKKFYLLAYILPYEREDGSKSWCDVGASGKNIENWGKEFGIKHYLIFEMKFE